MHTTRIHLVIAAAALGVSALTAANAMGQTAAVPFAAPAAKAPTPPETELLHNTEANILQLDYDASLARIPEDIRGGFGVDPDRINQMLQNILAEKTLAARARKDGMDQDPVVQARIRLEVDKFLAGLYIEHERVQWRKEFDALPNMEQKAREEWLTHPERYSGPTQYRVTSILFAVPDHSAVEARAMAEDARTKILAGADMAQMARELSADPNAKASGGQADVDMSSRSDPAIVSAVPKLKEGELSRPIKTSAGYQLLRLDSSKPGALMPFDDAKAKIIEQLRTSYVNTKLNDQVRGIKTDPTIVVNQPAVDALLVQVDPAFIKKVTQDAALRIEAKKQAQANEAQMKANAAGAPATPDTPATPGDTGSSVDHAPTTAR